MKRILLYGATGRTGSHVLTQALGRGYDVTALVRDPMMVAVNTEKLKVIGGLTTHIEDVRKAMEGCDIVISTLGGLHQSEILKLGKIDPPHILEQSIRHTITCMDEKGIKRIVVQTALGAGDSYEHVPWIMRTLIKYTHFKIVYDDHNMQEQLLQESDLDWIIVRPVGLNNGEDNKKLNITLDGAPPKFQISRKLVARFMLDCAESDVYLHKAPAISEG
jgi:putative NADH-flavin reductase